MANILTNRTARNGKSDIQIQGGLNTDLEIEAKLNSFVEKRGFAIPGFVLSKLKQSYYKAGMQNRPDDVLVEDIGYWNNK